MIKYALFLSILICSLDTTAQTIFEGRITANGNEATGISYATVLSNTDKKIGAISDENGYFEIRIPPRKDSINLTVSALGYRDSVIITAPPWEFMDIKLIEQPLVLEEINISANELVDLRIGSPDYAFAGNIDSTYRTVMANQIGASVGVLVDLGKANVIIKSVNLNIDDSSSFPVEYIAEIYGLKTRYEYYRLVARSKLIPLIRKPLKFTLSSPGWQNIDLSQEDIHCNYRFLIVAVSEFNQKDTTKNYSEKMFNYHLRTQVNQSRKISHFYIFGDKFAVLKPQDGIPAIYVDGYSEKKR